MEFKENYHTHTYRCKHAIGNIEDYCKVAVEKNFITLGFSDHNPLPDDWKSGIRMGTDEIKGYINDIEKAKIDFPTLNILTGFECDFLPKYVNYYKDYFINELKVDYLIGSVHFYPYKGKFYYIDILGPSKKLVCYADLYVKAIESGLFNFMGHPDLFGQAITKWNDDAIACSKEILEAAQACKIPLEINTSGILKTKQLGEKEIIYPKEQFWELASDYNIDVIVNTDAHAPQYLDTDVNFSEYLINKYNLNRISLNYQNN